jgi:hypothetical protein
MRAGTCAQVRMKPGKPLTFATIEPSARQARRLLVFGLPGNPVSSIVTYNLVVLPALRKLAGWQVGLLVGVPPEDMSCALYPLSYVYILWQRTSCAVLMTCQHHSTCVHQACKLLCDKQLLRMLLCKGKLLGDQQCKHRHFLRMVSQEPMLRRVHARTTSAIKLDPERPEYHRAALHWTPCVPPGFSCIC